MATKATGSKKNMVDETTPKKGSKSVTSKKKTNILKNIWTFICTHKVIFSILCDGLQAEFEKTSMLCLHSHSASYNQP